MIIITNNGLFFSTIRLIYLNFTVFFFKYAKMKKVLIQIYGFYLFLNCYQYILGHLILYYIILNNSSSFPTIYINI